MNIQQLLDVTSLNNFVIDETTYKAIEEMTWKEWINSDYSNGEYTSRVCGDNADNSLIMRKSDKRVVYHATDGKQMEVLSNVIKNETLYNTVDGSTIKCKK